MSYQILVCLDVEEMGGQLTPQQMLFVNDESRIQRAIHDLGISWPNTTVCIYHLTEVQKLKTPPTYQRYKVSSNGEIIPS